MRKGDDKPKFRPMQHQYNDDPEWQMEHDEDLDELESVMSNNYNMMLQKEFQGT